MSNTQPTTADLFDLLTQIRDGLNALDYTLMASVMPTLGQITDRISSTDANVFGAQQRVGSVGADLSGKIAALNAKLDALAPQPSANSGSTGATG